MGRRTNYSSTERHLFHKWQWSDAYMSTNDKSSSVDSIVAVSVLSARSGTIAGGSSVQQGSVGSLINIEKRQVLQKCDKYIITAFSVFHFWELELRWKLHVPWLWRCTPLIRVHWYSIISDLSFKHLLSGIRRLFRPYLQISASATTARLTGEGAVPWPTSFPCVCFFYPAVVLWWIKWKVVVCMPR